MYSLRTHVATGLWEGKATSTIGFYFLKKEEVEFSKKSNVDFADLKNTKHIQHREICLPFMMLDVMNAVLKEFQKSYSKLTTEVYLSPVDFKKMALQVVSHMKPEDTHSKFYALFRAMFILLNDNKSMKSKTFGKMVKPFLSDKNDEKRKTSYDKFRTDFLRLQTFCQENHITLKRSERVYEELKYGLELKTSNVFVSAYLNDGKHSKKEKDDIVDCLFNNAEINLEGHKPKPVVDCKNASSGKTKSKKKTATNTKQTLIQESANILSYEEEFGGFLDGLLLEAEKKVKSEKVKKIQESLLVKAKMKLLSQNGEENKENVLLYDIHTDASLNENRAGFGAVVCSVNLKNLQEDKLVVKMAGMKQIGAEGKLSTQIAELIAIQSIVKHMEDIKNQTGKDILFRVYSDNQGCVDALQGKPMWESNATIRKILQDIKTSPVRLMYAFEKGHIGNKWNEEAHKLSRYGRRFTEEKFVRV